MSSLRSTAIEPVRDVTVSTRTMRRPSSSAPQPITELWAPQQRRECLPLFTATPETWQLQYGIGFPLSPDPLFFLTNENVVQAERLGGRENVNKKKLFNRIAMNIPVHTLLQDACSICKMFIMFLCSLVCLINLCTLSQFVTRDKSAAEKRRQLIQESKFLGGDMEHTHLVKGLDFALLQKVSF